MAEITTTEAGLLDGSLEDVPEVSSKIVRVFLSSTFSGKDELLTTIHTWHDVSFRLIKTDMLFYNLPCLHVHLPLL